MQQQPLIVPGDYHPATQGAPQRTVNIFGVRNELHKQGQTWQNFPGWELVTDLGNPIRAAREFSGKGYSVVVSGSKVFKFNNDGGYEQIGSLRTSDGKVGIAESGIEVMLADGQAMYNWDSGRLAPITMPFTKPPTDVHFHEGYFETWEPDTGDWYVSDAYDGKTWNALQVANAEDRPDTIRAINSDNVLWIAGTRTIQAYDRIAATFPFTPNFVMKAQYGLVGDTLVEMGNTVYFLGRPANGVGAAVYRMNGATPEKVSTPGYEALWSSYGNVEDAEAWTVGWKGQEWYVITFPGANSTFVFDTQGTWTEWGVFDHTTTNWKRHPGTCFWTVGNRGFFGDANGRVWRFTDTTTMQGNDEQVREFTTQVFHDNNEPISISRVWLDMATGQHSADNDDVSIMMAVSRDGGRTFGNWERLELGDAGHYSVRAQWWRLGLAYNLVLKFRVTDDYQWVIYGGGIDG